MAKTKTNRSLADTEFVAFDLETTGLHPVSCRIVEFGAVRFRGDGTVLGEFEQLVHPGCRIPAEVQRIHGISDRMVQGQPSCREVLPEFLAFLQGGVPMAHNAGFDMSFLAAAISQCGLPLPKQEVFDTCAIARRCLRLPNYKLETIGRHFGLIEAEDHRALADSRLLKEAFRQMIAGRSLDRLADLHRIAPPTAFSAYSFDFGHVPPRYEVLIAAIKQGRPIALRYDGGNNPGSIRQVTPRTFIESRSVLYLVGRCHASDCDKSYRLDRITAFELSDLVDMEQ